MKMTNLVSDLFILLSLCSYNVGEDAAVGLLYQYDGDACQKSSCIHCIP